MMEIGILGKSAAMVGAIGTIGGGALALDHLHASQSWASQHQAQHRVNQIFDYVKLAEESGAAQWICEAIQKELIELCNEDKVNFLCENADAVRDIKRRAGCQ